MWVSVVLVFTSVFCVLMVVSFFKESGTAELVSFLTESVTLVTLDESVFTESEEEADPLPLQAANDAAITKANRPFFNVVFIVVRLNKYNLFNKS